MASIKIKLDKDDDKTYEIDPDKLTLGEARVLKKDYGMATLGELNFGDPDQMVGILVLAIKREHPELTDSDVLAKVENLDFVSVVEGIGTDEANPPSAANGSGKPKATGKRATTPKTAGTPN